MNWTVYGIRLKGDKEVRYIGFTGGDLAKRFRAHLRYPIVEWSYRPLLPWIRENRDNVEFFPITKCETQTEARATESTMIALFLRLNHRLLNGAQVPWHLRITANRISARSIPAEQTGAATIAPCAAAPSPAPVT